jgi:hypothetical protein
MKLNLLWTAATGLPLPALTNAVTRGILDEGEAAVGRPH